MVIINFIRDMFWKIIGEYFLGLLTANLSASGLPASAIPGLNIVEIRINIL